MSTLEIFGWGIFGGIAAELAALSHFYHVGNGELPPRYKDKVFYIVRGLFVGVGGRLSF